MKLIGLNGYARSGKTTAAQTLVTAGWQLVSIADVVWDVALEANPPITSAGRPLSSVVFDLGREGAKHTYPEVRRFLQRLGRGIRDTFGYHALVDQALLGLDPDGSYVVTNVRFPVEAATITARGGAIFRVTRPGVGPINGDSSETALDGWELPTIDNDGTVDELAAAVRRAVGLVTA